MNPPRRHHRDPRALRHAREPRCPRAPLPVRPRGAAAGSPPLCCRTQQGGSDGPHNVAASCRPRLRPSGSRMPLMTLTVERARKVLRATQMEAARALIQTLMPAAGVVPYADFLSCCCDAAGPNAGASVARTRRVWICHPAQQNRLPQAQYGAVLAPVSV